MKKINWRYVSGEILIVTIGITLAFGLNTWAGKQADKKVKKEYLKSLIADVENEKSELEKNIDLFQEKRKSAQEIFPYFSGKTEGRDSIFRKIFGLAEIIDFQPNNITYITLLNSGDMKLFTKVDFKKSLESHYTKQDKVRMDYSRQEKIMDKYMGSFLIYEMDYQKIRKSDYSYIDNKTLQNIISSLYGSYGIAISSSEVGIKNCDLLLEKLKSS